MMTFGDEMFRIRQRAIGSHSTPESLVVLRQRGTYYSYSGEGGLCIPSLNPQRHALTVAPPTNFYNKVSEDITLTLNATSM